MRFMLNVSMVVVAFLYSPVYAESHKSGQFPWSADSAAAVGRFMALHEDPDWITHNEDTSGAGSILAASVAPCGIQHAGVNPCSPLSAMSFGGDHNQNKPNQWKWEREFENKAGTIFRGTNGENVALRTMSGGRVTKYWEGSLGSLNDLRSLGDESKKRNQQINILSRQSSDALQAIAGLSNQKTNYKKLEIYWQSINYGIAVVDVGSSYASTSPYGAVGGLFSKIAAWKMRYVTDDFWKSHDLAMPIQFQRDRETALDLLNWDVGMFANDKYNELRRMLPKHFAGGGKGLGWVEKAARPVSLTLHGITIFETAKLFDNNEQVINRRIEDVKGMGQYNNAALDLIKAERTSLQRFQSLGNIGTGTSLYDLMNDPLLRPNPSSALLNDVREQFDTKYGHLMGRGYHSVVPRQPPASYPLKSSLGTGSMRWPNRNLDQYVHKFPQVFGNPIKEMRQYQLMSPGMRDFQQMKRDIRFIQGPTPNLNKYVHKYPGIFGNPMQKIK